MVTIVSNRRTFLSALIGGAAGLSISYRAYGQAAPPPITATKLSKDLAMVSGDGGNVGVVIGADNLMMIDGGLPDRAGDLIKAIADQVAGHKVDLLFDTHWHFDHIGCNETLGQLGVKIMAHENVKTRLSTKQVMEAMNRTFEPLKPEGLPTQTFREGGKMTYGEEKIEYRHVPTAHTDGDTYLFFPDPNVIHTGDLFFNKTYPVIDYSTGGWIGGMHTAAETILKVGDKSTRIIPGHGPLASKDDLKATHDMLGTVFARLEKMSKEGKTMEEVLAAAPNKDLDVVWGKGMMSPERFLRMAYPSIARHNG